MGIMDFLLNYGLFLAKTLTILGGLLLVMGFAFSMAGKEGDDRPKLKIKKVNKRFERYAELMNQKILSKKAFKQFKKAQQKAEESSDDESRRRIFWVDFDGDVKASATDSLVEEINAILMVATPEDEVLIRVNSGGGMVHAYGLAASQLQRIREHNIPLTIAIDKVAASGGYMMACVANRIIAAPFAIVGSIGVIAQLPNFHRALKKHNVEFEQIMAGEYKRTLSLFGENTKKDREKTQEDVENIHLLFKNFITQHRPSVNISEVATGEHWHGMDALKLNLVDQLMTSDEYLMTAAQHADIYQVRYKVKRKVTQKLIAGMDAMLKALYNWQNNSTY